MLFKNDPELEIGTIIISLSFCLLFLKPAIYGYGLPIVISSICFILTIIFIIKMIPGRIYVLVDEEGVTYRNVIYKTTVSWKNVSRSYSHWLNSICTVYIEENNGTVHSLPINGFRAEEIAFYINNYPDRFSNN